MAELQLGIRISADGKSATAEIQNVDKSLKQVDQSAKQTSQSLSAAETASRLLGGAFAAMGVAEVAKELFNTAREVDRLNSMMAAASGSARAAGANMAYVKDLSNTLGLDVKVAADSFAKLTAASKGTALQGQNTRDIFGAVSKATAALGLSADESAGALTAISQMMSKGKVSAEELRGQLGERLPGAFKLMADSMGVSTAALDEMLQKGEVIAADVLPKFAKALDDTYSNARFDGINQQINRLNNTWFEFKQNFVDTSGFATAVKTLNDLLGKLSFDVKASFGNGQDGYKAALEKRIAEQKRVVEQMIGGQSMLGPFGQAAFPNSDIAERQKSIAEMEKALASLNQDLSKSISEGVAEATKSGIENAKPPTTQDVMSMIAASAKKYNVNEAFALAVAKVESNFNQGAVSPKGAIGVGQLMPDTAARFGVDAKNIEQNIDGMVRYLKFLSGKFHNDLRLAAAAYNAGEGTVQKVGNAVPNNKETRNYVDKVGKEYEAFLAKYPGGLPFSDTESQKREADAAAQVFKDSIEKMIADAENAGKLSTSRHKTEIAQIEMERKASAQAIQEKIAGTTVWAEKLALAEQGRLGQIDAIQREADIQRQIIDEEASLLQRSLDAKNQQIAGQEGINQKLAETNRLKREASVIETSLAMLADQRAQVQIDAQDKINAANQQGISIREQQQQQEQMVREEQLRQNAFWDQLMGRMEDYAATWKEITGQQASGFNRLMVQTNKYAKNVEQIGKAYDDMQKANHQRTGEDSMVLSIAEGVAQAEAALNMMAQTLLAVRDGYEKGSKGYNDMTDAAERLMEVQRTLQVVEGVLAVIHQLSSGDVYTAIPRALGVAAMIASMNIETSASAKSTAYVDQTGNNGGVFGDSKAQSDSIAESLKIIENNSSIDLNYSSAMLAALQGIEDALNGVANQIILNVRPDSWGKTGVIASGVDGLSRLGFLGNAIGKAIKAIDPLGSFIGKFIFNETRKIVAYGIQGIPQTLNSVLKKGFEAFKFTDIEKKTKVFMITVSKSLETRTSELDKGVKKQFTLVIKGIADALREGSKAFGISAGQFIGTLGRFVIDIGRLDLAKLTGEEIQKKLNEVFSTLTDQMARRLTKGALKDFQQIGEGYAKTFFRVAEGTNRATGELEQLGMKAINFKDIINKQGDAAAEISRQTIEAQGNLGASSTKFIHELKGSSEEIIAAYQRIKEATQLARAAGITLDVSREMANAAGGLDNFVSSLKDFNDNFLTESERTIGSWQSLAESFTRLGLKMPRTNDDFKKLVKGIDVTSIAGQKLFGQVVALSGAFSDATAALNASLGDVQAAYDRQKDLAKSLRDYVMGLSVSNQALSPEAKYNAAKKQFDDALAKARAGDEVAQGNLQEIAQTFLDASHQYNASTAGYAADLNKVTSGLDSVATSIDGQVSIAEQQVSALDRNSGALMSLADALAAYSGTMSAVNDIITNQNSGTDGSGIGTGVSDIGTVNTQNNYQQARIDASIAYETKLNDLVKDLWAAKAKNKPAIETQIDALMREINTSAIGLYVETKTGLKTKSHKDDAFQVRLRAKGGYTPSGFAIVGEQGPELVRFDRPSQILNARETSKALADDSRTLEFLSGIKQELRALVTTQAAANPQLVEKLTNMEARLSKMERTSRLAPA